VRQVRIAAQAYTIRDSMAADPDGAIARLRSLGYSNLELAGFGGRTAEDVRRALAGSGVTAIAMHVPLSRLEGDLGAVLDEARTVRVRDLVVPWLDEQTRRDGIDGYRAAATRLNRVAEGLIPEGFRLHYHNHDFELALQDAETGLERLLRDTDAPVRFELDLGWLWKAGEDPGSWLRRASGRVRFVHAKDVPILARTDVRFVPVGEGVMEWASLAEDCVATGVEWAIVEDEDAADPFESLRRSLARLRQLGFDGDEPPPPPSERRVGGEETGCR
jgi:sugar phosphate isomerase/epimerase